MIIPREFPHAFLYSQPSFAFMKYSRQTWLYTTMIRCYKLNLLYLKCVEPEMFQILYFLNLGIFAYTLGDSLGVGLKFKHDTYLFYIHLLHIV